MRIFHSVFFCGAALLLLRLSGDWRASMVKCAAVSVLGMCVAAISVSRDLAKTDRRRIEMEEGRVSENATSDGGGEGHQQ
jgi:hypothetical protein